MRKLISIVIPACNAKAHIAECLQSVRESEFRDYEIIVVDDGSTDETSAIAATFGAKVILNPERRGPAFARNMGASEATSEILFFLDSDVTVKPETLSKIYDSFSSDATLDALIGSYDRKPSSPDFISQYRNLMHAFVHQVGSEQASTFWSGCGAIRRTVFFEHSGFSEGYDRPAIEDIELGYRLVRDGKKIILDRSLEVKHLKKWTFWGLVKTDIMDRGIPWTELILRDRFMPDDLNLQLSQRVSVGLVFILVALSCALVILSGIYVLLPLLAILFLVMARWWGEYSSYERPPMAWAIMLSLVFGVDLLAYHYHMRGLIPCVTLTPALLALRHRYSKQGKLNKLHRWIGIGYIGLSVLLAMRQLPNHHLILACFAVLALLALLNSQFYIFLAGNRGVAFMFAAIPFHLLYHFYNGISFFAGMGRHYWMSFGSHASKKATPEIVPVVTAPIEVTKSRHV
jgi:glycosyltransferase involved in cell wall biosynthesis